MPQTVDDPKLVIRDILRNGWDNTEIPTDLADTDIHTGWYDDGRGFPQVGVSNRSERALNGGETGFSAIAGDGSGAIQDRTGVVLVTAFAGSREAYSQRGVERLQAEQMGDQISAIIGRNQTPDEYLMLSVGPRDDLVDTDASPTEYAVQFSIRYIWKKEPPR